MITNTAFGDLKRYKSKFAKISHNYRITYTSIPGASSLNPKRIIPPAPPAPPALVLDPEGPLENRLDIFLKNQQILKKLIDTNFLT